MAFNRPTLQQIIDRIAGDFVAKISGATTLAMRSVLQVMARTYGGAVHLLYGYLDNMAKQLYATTATGVYLDLIGGELGIFRKAASKASGAVTFTGTVSTIIPAGTALRSSSLIRYLTDSQMTVEAGGTVTGDVTCDSEGTDGNEDPGVVLTLDSPIAGLDSTATIGVNGLANGFEEEDDEDYRDRILARKRFAPSGGTATDLENWSKELTFVTRAWSVPQYNGIGTVALFFVCDNQSPIIPTTDQIAEVREHLEGHIDANGIVVGIPVTMLPGLFIQQPVLRSINFIIDVYPNTQAVKDAVEAQLIDLISREAYPSNTLRVSSVNEAISAAAGEIYHTIYYPNQDTVMGYNEVGEIGILMWGG